MYFCPNLREESVVLYILAMRKGALIFIAVCALMIVCTTGCTDKKLVAADTLEIDSFLVDTAGMDTLEVLISEQPMPKAADELFDDFIFNFAANKKLQFSRIAFPLPVKDGEKITLIEKNQWSMEHFFMEQGYYTLILDNRKQLRMTKDTSVNHVVLEKVDFVSDNVKMYNFDRLAGQWNLTSIENLPVEDCKNASFLRFYEKFSTDSLFLMESLNDPISFTGPNPDDDFSTITADIVPEQWPDLGLDDLPSGLIYNIIYGQKYTQDNHKVLIMRGIANGLEVELSFNRMDNGAWKLVKVVE